MSGVKAVSQTYRIVVDPVTSSVSVIHAGPIGPSGIVAIRSSFGVLRWVFIGDELVDGFMPMALTMAGGLVARPDSVSETLDDGVVTDLYSEMEDIYVEGTVHGTVIFAGSNDAKFGVSASTTVSMLSEMIFLAKRHGPVVICTVPPLGASFSDATHMRVHAINVWVKMFAPALGAEIADIWTSLVDPPTGKLKSIYDSSDGTTPNALGYQRIAMEVARAMIRVSGRVRPYGLVTSELADQFIPDPLAESNGVRPTEWTASTDTGEEGMRALRIMPLGDSITQGRSDQPGYRRPLWNLLISNGFNIDLVGSQTGYWDGIAGPEDYDTAHEGHGGWRIGAMRDQASGWVFSARPDIVLVHAGTNDALSGQPGTTSVTQLGQLIDEIREGQPGVVIVMAKIMPADASLWPVFNLNYNIDQQNDGLAALVSSKTTPESPIYIVDQHTGFVLETDSFDGLHPGALGADKFAENWYAKLVDIINDTPQDFWAIDAPVSELPPSHVFGESVVGTEQADPNAVELGMKFFSEEVGFVTGVRFYKTAGNNGTHTGRLWTSAGTLLGTVVFTGETETGWQEQAFASPIAIAANTTYVISYHTTSGNYATETPFTVAVDNPPLHAPADAPGNPNGVFKFGAGGVFPNDTYAAVNLLVDVSFNVGTPSEYAIVNDLTGTLPAGRWAQMDVTAQPSAPETRRLIAGGTIAGFFSSLDKTLLTGHLQVEDMSNTWLANCAAGTSQVRVELVNQDDDVIAVVVENTPGIPHPTIAKVYDIGPMAFPSIVPPGTTEIFAVFTLVVAAGKRLKLRVGDVELFNTTKNGLVSAFE